MGGALDLRTLIVVTFAGVEVDWAGTAVDEEPSCVPGLDDTTDDCIGCEVGLDGLVIISILSVAEEVVVEALELATVVVALFSGISIGVPVVFQYQTLSASVVVLVH